MHPVDHIAAGSSCKHCVVGGQLYSMRKIRWGQRRKPQSGPAAETVLVDILRKALGWMGLAG